MRTYPASASMSLYFGWRLVLALALCSAALMGVSLSSFIMFAEPLGVELNWSNADTGTLVSAIWLTGPLVLIAAPVLRKLRPWPTVAAGMVFEVVSLVLTQATSSFEVMFALRLLAGLGLVLVVAAAPVIVAHWFKDRFATAMSIVWSSGAAGQMVLPPIAVALMETLGWRQAALVLAGILVVTTILCLLLSRGASSPADFGLLQDGVVPDAADAGQIRSHTASDDLPWIAALRSLRPLTALVMCVAAFCLGATTLAFQSQSPALLAHFGLSAGEVAVAVSAFYGAALLGSLVCGWLLDRLPAAAVSLGVSLLVFLSLVVLGIPGFAGGLVLVGMLLCAFGVGIGAGEVMWITLFKRQFGTPAFATTYGIFFFSFQVGMASGGYIGGRSFEEGGGSALLLGLGLLYVAPAIFSIIRPARRNSEG